jgi:hypothetical protein
MELAVKRTAAEKWAPCIPIVAAPSCTCVGVRVQGGFVVLWFDASYGLFPGAAFRRTW